MFDRSLPLALLMGSVIAFAGVTTAHAQSIAKATLENSDGDPAGSVTFTEAANGVLITAELRNLKVGAHGFHIHETGACESDFSSAGDHFNPDGKEHGFDNPNGYHAGDLPNIFVANDGIVKFHVFTSRVSLGDGSNSILDDDGSAVIVHADPDTYLAKAGAGGRVACGVISAVP